jgi:hypothetical protein
VQREFTACVPDEVWLTDITEHSTDREVSCCASQGPVLQPDPSTSAAPHLLTDPAAMAKILVGLPDVVLLGAASHDPIMRSNSTSGSRRRQRRGDSDAERAFEPSIRKAEAKSVTRTPTALACAGVTRLRCRTPSVA